ncbi:ABC transporter [Pseudomonas soli]|uniref:Transport permease protein n=1 Tax=Pseudomonas soli TaxID=1306993 RepID=A0A1H9FTK1_9PSED|nr:MULTISPECIES: ABC transporter permease [Pseudomonas]AUY33298.1 ABC transporter [Pseudomonas sp. PONIH3]MDT3716151.1 ABC transporter permease [Pseudomonas soli]MDT3732765.1 ABC transporter permease [Pseudomonas soli]MEE1881922.1 ABC transporter permease [Pseudomonas soli]NBK41187.1 ABC transporter [Pseudomonas soli]
MSKSGKNRIPLKETVVSNNSQFNLLGLLKNLWEFRLLLWVFCKRDLKGRYTQTIFGLGWVILTPLITVGVFVIVFGVMVKVPTDGLPTIMFYLVAVIPWYAFMNVLNPSVQMIEGNAGLISKVYFPRLLIGGSYAVGAAVDFLIAYTLLITPFAIAYNVWTPQLLLIMPLLLLCTLMTGLGVGLILAPLNAKYRDVKHLVPLALQLFYYSTPAIYPVSAVPPWAKPWYSVNPLSLVISSYRDAMHGHWPSSSTLFTLITIAVVCFTAGVLIFQHFDKNVVDTL